ncbi:matrixin family metalloprotease [Agrilactobacillus fermenti]|uniref:matrixin family metalloprotease n=1 Tax=Agrilactobacillus fermenti TaxID=2586909 RepID=UPI003A5C616A
MHIFGRSLKFVLYLSLIVFFGLMIPKIYQEYHDFTQRQQIFSRVREAQNQVSNQAAPANWQSLNNWWLVNQEGVLYYNDSYLNTQQRALTRQAAAWWNQAAGQTLIQPQPNNVSKADVYLAYVNDDLLNYSGLTGTNHLLLLNQADMTRANNENDTLNVIIHEFGHALGLAHAPQSYHDVMSPSQVATGQVQQASNYDIQALKASLSRMQSALHQNMTIESYQQVAGQTPYPTDLTALADPLQNGRASLAAVITGMIQKVSHRDNLTAQQTQILQRTKTSVKTITNNEAASDQQIRKARADFKQLITAFNLQNYFPQAYPQAQSQEEGQQIKAFFQKIQGSF